MLIQMLRDRPRLKKYLIYGIGIFAILTLFVFDVAKDSISQRYDKSREPARVKNVVQFYNKALEKAISENKSNYLEKYATFEARQRVGLYISYEILERKMKMEPKLVSFNIEKYELKKKNATVWTSETWQSTYYSSTDSTQVLSKEVIDYKMKYKLTKEKKDWLVADTEIIAESKKAVK